MARRALFIVNRHSRLGQSDLSTNVRLLIERGFQVELALIDNPGEIPEIIRSFASRIDLVVLAGGDGTMNAAVDALVEHDLPLGIVPMGTANDLARTLGIPLSPADALAVVAEGRPHRIDLGRVNGKHFFNVASLGLAAEVTRHHTVERKRRFWLFAYVLSVMDAYRSTRPFRATLSCYGRTRRVRAIQVSVANGRHYGGGMTVAEDAAIDDGRLDVYCIRPLSFWRLLALFAALRRGRLRRRREVLVLRCQELDITTRRPLAINTDGELTTRTPAHFTVVPQALTVFVPASYRAETRQVNDAAD